MAKTPLTDNVQKGDDLARDCLHLLEDARAERADVEDAILDERSFLYDQNHYFDQEDRQRRNDRIRPRGRETYSKHRRKKAQIGGGNIHLYVRPVDAGPDIPMSDVSRRVLEHDILNPRKHYKRLRKRMVSSALASRVGAMALDFEPGIGPWGEIVPRLMDPLNLYWAPGWHDHDDLTCPWTMEVKRIRPEDAQRMKSWKNTSKLTPDDGTQLDGGRPGRFAFHDTLESAASGAAGPGPWPRKDFATILVIYFTNDESRKTVERDEITLEPRDRFMACTTQGCPGEFRVPDGSVLPVFGSSAMMEEPMEGGIPVPPCPICGSVMERADKVRPTLSMLSYPRGRMVVVAPFSAGGIVLFDDAWPIPMRHAPYMVYRCYDDPYRQIGSCDTTLDWDMQLISNSLLRFGYEQMSRSGVVMVVSDGNLTDGTSEQTWQKTDEAYQVAYWNGMGSPHISFHQSQGLPSQWNAYYGAVQGNLRTDQGTNDLGLTPDKSRDIAASSIAQQSELGEVPVEDHREDLGEVESGFFGVWWDMILATWPIERFRRLFNDDPQLMQAVQMLLSDSAPNLDVQVLGEPSWDKIDGELTQALNAILASPYPELMLQIMVQAARIPPSIAQQLMGTLMQARASQTAQPQPNQNGKPPQSGNGKPRPEVSAAAA